jgi:competence protein ComGF
VKDVLDSSEYGFTLIESLLLLQIFMMVALLFPLIIKTYTSIDHSLSPSSTYEWNLMVIQFRNEFVKAEEIDVKDNLVKLKIGNTIVSYEVYGTNIRRRVDLKGHEIVLQYAPSIIFEKEDSVLFIHVKFEKGEERVASFSSPLFLEEKVVVNNVQTQ